MPPDERLERVKPLPRPKMRPKNIPPMGRTVSPVMGGNDPENRIGVKGPKGGGKAAKAQVKVGSDIFNQYNNDGRFGYYNQQGYYVPADIDMRDGGGADANDTFFEGGGLISLLGNIAKVRPYGQRNTPREQIGFRNIDDMFDRGGPQHSGGEYRGGGTISMLGNLADRIGGADQGTRTRYTYETPVAPVVAQAEPLGAGVQPSVETRTLDGKAANITTVLSDADKGIESSVNPLYPVNTIFPFQNRQAAIEALRRRAKNFNKLMQENPAEAEELIQEAVRMQIPTGI